MPDAISITVKTITTITMKQLTISSSRIRQHLSDEEHDDVRRMYAEGMRLSDIAEYIGCSRPTVISHTTGLSRRNRTWTADEIHYVTSNPDGKCTRELAELFMVSQSSIRNIKNRNL